MERPAEDHKIPPNSAQCRCRQPALGEQAKSCIDGSYSLLSDQEAQITPEAGHKSIICII